MSNSYKAFIFKDYIFDEQSKTATFYYGYDDDLTFSETLTFDFDYTDYNQKALDSALQLLFFITGVSYYKAYGPKEIIVKKGSIDKTLQLFLNTLYQKGLGEFWYVNNLDPKTPINFPLAGTDISRASHVGSGKLVGVGGGKDSLVSIELLRNQEQITTWSVSHKSQLSPLVQKIGLEHYWVGRQWDKQLLDLPDAYNGHIPISAILAAAGVVVAILSGKKDVVVSNEQSANEATLSYQGISINHQYSKSQDFERSFQHILTHYFGDSVRYYSLLRPFSELNICELFAKTGFDIYKDVFSSCNRAFTHTSSSMSWCGECTKCAFIYLGLSNFVPENELIKLWGGQNLLQKKSLEPLYKSLLGIAGDKPLDCVGEIAESRTAMQMTFKQYPELKDIYQFDDPDFDYKKVSGHEMPKEVYASIMNQLVNL